MRIIARTLFILICLGLLFPLNTKAEEQNLRDDYIRASLLVVDPAAEVYSVFGHCALRLDCPSQQMDYCFTFEMSTTAEDVVSFFKGTAMGAFKPAPTDLYIDYYRQQGRSVKEYVLNLLPSEKLQLWRVADEEIAKGFSRRYGYMHAQCSSMIVYLVSRALEAPVSYHQLPEGLDGSFRDLMLEACKPYPWSAFFWQSIMGPEGDETEPLAHKLVPAKLPLVWQNVTVGSEGRHLIVSQGQLIVEGTNNADSCWLSPCVVFLLVLLVVIFISLLQLLKGWRMLPLAIDILLLTVHTLVSVFLVWLVCFSEQEGTGWNWYLLVFNPIPLLLWIAVPRWRRQICYCLCGVMILTLALTPFIPQLDLPHALLLACFAVRLVTRLKVKSKTQI